MISAETRTSNHNAFNTDVVKVQEWLDSNIQSLTDLCNPEGQRETVNKKLLDLQTLNDTLPKGKSQLGQVMNLRQLIGPETSEEGHVIIDSEVQRLQQLWGALNEGERKWIAVDYRTGIKY